MKFIRGNDDDTQASRQSLKHEVDVYTQLQNCDGVVRCLGFPEDCIEMESMKNGDLAAYLKAQHPTRSLQLSWFRQMVSTLARIHDSHVIVEDIARKNFLLSDELC
ncbi:hypothetical protein PAAG_11099 [Paracoccidioides lutzii Pb01]|uniref:Protein kinase domain-containing protein n=1 Tax=Paracoccidioides lutzii (strain ATCC MYA-826 / Pb01) TaxID=502779 RepID=A0A0A2V303_PARBA|nr:hypothetical protein PAAG_11099 [Paracoccidioides lutzii Pb01]KGQ02146.1 hypothetical protein PAAG_11099 [Paracoccidioides lutzii Pb01]